MKQTFLTLTFLESLRIANFTLESGSTITALYLGGGDMLRVEYEGRVLELPSSLVRQEIVR